MLQRSTRIALVVCVGTTVNLAWLTSAYGQGFSAGTVQALAVDPTNSATVYAGTPAGIYKTTDAGASWVRVDAGLRYDDVAALAIDPSAPCQIYAGINSNEIATVVPGMPPIVITNSTTSILAVSTDCGANWTYPTRRPFARAVWRLAFTGGATPALLLSIGRNQAAGFSYEIAGDIARVTPSAIHQTPSFPEQLPFGDHSLTTVPPQPCSVYVGGRLGRVWKNTSCGDFSWTLVGSPMLAENSPTAVTALAAHPADEETLLAGTAAGIVFRKRAADSDWVAVGRLAGAVKALVFTPNGTALYAAASDSAYKSVDEGATWARLAVVGGLANAVGVGAAPVLRSYVGGGATSTSGPVVLFDCGAQGGLRSTASPVTVHETSVAVAAARSLHCSFTDPFLSSGVIPIKAVHITELRMRIDALRVYFDLPAFVWTDSLLTPATTPVRAVHLLELRGALAEAYEWASQAAPVFTDSNLGVGTIAKGVHVTELREAVETLEGLQTGRPVDPDAP